MAKYFTIIICAAISAYVGLHGYINPDCGWLISATGRWLAGERLYVDVIETNPPLVIYLTAIPLLIGQKFGFNPVDSFVVFVAALSAISAIISVSKVESKPLSYWLIFALILIPAVNFGQREHFFLIFATPYFMQLFRERKPSILLAIFAAIGFALKPYFLIFWLFAVLFSKVKIFDITNFIIGFLLAGYAAYVYFCVPQYMDLLPSLLKYYNAFALPLNTVLLSVGVALSFYLIPLLVFAVKYPKEFDYQLKFISALFFAAMICAVAQLKGWSNHQLPAYFFGGVLALLITLKTYPKRKELWGKVIIAISALILLVQLGLGAFGNYRVATKLNDKELSSLVEVLDMYATQGYVYNLGFDLPDLYPALNYSSAKSSSRYGHLWMLPGIYENMQLQNGVAKFHQPGKRSDDETVLIGEIIGDIARKPPKLILVSDKEYLTKQGVGFKFDFIGYLSQEEDFKRIFANYRKVSEVGKIKVYSYHPAN
jgi:hypothetical protein